MSKSNESVNLDGEPGLAFEYWEERKEAVETTRYYSNLFTNSNRIKQVETNTAKASSDTYIGINGRQWSDKNLKTLDDQKRIAHTFNITKPNADKVLGQFIKNPYLATFSSINQETMGTSNIIQSLYDYDLERGGWRREFHKFIKDAIIHTGIMEMYKDYAHSPLGNVGLRALNRFLDVRFDPYWSTEKVSDCQYYFKSNWLTAREIRDSYQDKSEEIGTRIKAFERRDGAAIDNETEEQLAARDSEFYDQTSDRYRVIEVTYMQKVYKKKQYTQKLEDYKKENSLPDTARGDNPVLIEFNEYERICKVMTMVPGISHGLILQEGNHPVQVGKLPIYVASSDMTMGERQGLVTSVIDAQANLNKTKSMIIGNQVVSTNGGLLVKDDLFKNNESFMDFCKNRNVPGKVFKVDGNGKLSDGIIPIPMSSPPQGLDESLAWTERFVEKSFNNTEAINSTTGSNESSLLFKAKRMQTNIAHANLEENIMQAFKEVAQDFFYFSKKVYAGKERTFTNARTAERFTVNKRTPKEKQIFDPLETNATHNSVLSGFTTVNEIATLPRHDVVIKKSETGLDQKEEAMNQYDLMSQRSNNPIMKALWEKQIVPLAVTNPDSVKDMEAAADMFVTFQTTQMQTQIVQMGNATTQSTIQTQQMQAQSGQPPQQPGAEQGAEQKIEGAREVGNRVGNGNLPESIANDSTGTNNASASDV